MCVLYIQPWHLILSRVVISKWFWIIWVTTRKYFICWQTSWTPSASLIILVAWAYMNSRQNCDHVYVIYWAHCIFGYCIGLQQWLHSWKTDWLLQWVLSSGSFEVICDWWWYSFVPNMLFKYLIARISIPSKIIQ